MQFIGNTAPFIAAPICRNCARSPLCPFCSPHYPFCRAPPPVISVALPYRHFDRAKRAEKSQSHVFPSCHFGRATPLSFRLSERQRAEKSQSTVTTKHKKFHHIQAAPAKGKWPAEQAERVLLKKYSRTYPNFEIFRLRSR